MRSGREAIVRRFIKELAEELDRVGWHGSVNKVPEIKAILNEGKNMIGDILNPSKTEPKRRKPKYNPDEGDIFETVEGVFVLVDWAEMLSVGFRTSDGREGSFNYRDSWARFIGDATLVRYGTPENWPWTYDGYDMAEKKKGGPTKEEALKFLADNTTPEAIAAFNK